MAEARSAPRTNVVWRAAIAVMPGKIVPAKIINFSQGGLKLQCLLPLRDGETYQMMMEVPSHRDASVRTQVICKAKCMYSTLCDDAYHAGMKYFDVPSEHTALLQSWNGKPHLAETRQSEPTPIHDSPDMV
jgi:hypothetical protein